MYQVAPSFHFHCRPPAGYTDSPQTQLLPCRCDKNDICLALNTAALTANWLCARIVLYDMKLETVVIFTFNSLRLLMCRIFSPSNLSIKHVSSMYFFHKPKILKAVLLHVNNPNQTVGENT